MGYTKDLEESGYSFEQANALMRVMEEVMNKNFATKDDLHILRIELKSDMKEMESSIRAEMKELKVDINYLRKDMINAQDKIVIRMSGVMIIILGAFVTLQKFI